MKKTAGRISLAILAAMLCLFILPVTAMAASNTQDGLSVIISTDKSDYTSGETVGVTATVTNTNGFTVNNVKMEITLPDGLKLSSGEKTLTIASLAAGQTQTLTLAALAENPGANPDGGNPAALPKTGDSSNVWLWLIMALLSLGTIIVLVASRKRKRGTAKYISLMLCAILVFSIAAPATSFAAAATETKSFSVNETVKVDGVSRIITAKITYDWDGKPVPPPATYTLTAPAAETTNGVTATVTFDKTSPQTAGTSVKATVTLTGTATKTGEFTIDLTSTKAGLTTSPKTKTVTVGATPTDTYDFTFTVPGQSVDDFTLTFSFVEAAYGLTAPAAETTNGVTATVTFDKTSPQAAGTSVKATVTLSGTAAKAGEFTIDLTSVKAGLTTSPKTETVTVGATLTDAYDFTFIVPGRSADDFTLTFSFVEAAYAINLTDDGKGTAFASVSGVAATDAKQGDTVTITATPTNATNFEFMEWEVVSGGVTISSTTANPSTFTMPSNAVTVKAKFKPTAAGIAAANAEAAKITRFMPDMNTTNTLWFLSDVSSMLNSGTTVNFVSIKTGTNASDATTTDWGASLDKYRLYLNTQKVVDNGNYAYAELTFTVTLDGVTSDERTLDISNVVGGGSPADNLRTDKERLTNMSGGNGDLFCDTQVTGSFNVKKFVPGGHIEVVMTSGVSIPRVGNNPGFKGTLPNTDFISAGAGGNLVIELGALPPSPDNEYIPFYIALTCAGTSYAVEIPVIVINP